MKFLLQIVFVFASLCVFIPVPTVRAQEITNIAGGAEVLQKSENGLWQAKLIGENQSARLEVVAANGPNFSSAWQVQTVQKPAQPQGVGLEFRNSAEVKSGSVMLAEFWTRSVPANSNQTQQFDEAVAWVSWQQATSPWNDSMSLLIGNNREWKRWQLPFVATRDYAPNEARWVFFAGYQTQTLEIGGLSVRSFDANTKLENLPRTQQIYAGQQADAPWRKSAQERIGKLRQGDLQVRVRDKSGAPLNGARVRVRMQKHAWNFGASISETRVLGDGAVAELPNDTRYREEARSLFNQFVLEGGATRWYAWEAQNGAGKKAHIQRGRESLSLLRSQSQFGPRVQVRAVPVVWPSWRLSGVSSKTIYDNTLAQKGARAAREALRNRVRDHVRETMTEFAPQVDEWDVINEPIAERDISDILGRDASVEWLQIARQSDPDAKLFVNDFGILSGGGFDSVHHNALYEYLEDLLRRGAPLDGLGFQGHMGAAPTPPEKLLQILNRFSTLNKPIQITEFDTTFADAQLQADYTRDFLTIMFSHPNVRGVCLWGFWDGQHWKRNATLFDQNWKLKPAGEAWKQLVFKDWWTNTEGTTAANGEYKTRAFYGDYEIELEHNGQTVTKTFTLQPQNAPFVISLP